MTVAYLKDIPPLLASVAAVRGSDFHMEGERDMLKYCFAFDHINYARYISFQHVYLSDLEAKGDPANDNMIKRGIRESLSGDKFSSIHGDLRCSAVKQNGKLDHIYLALVQRSMLSTHASKLLTFILNYGRSSMIQ